MVVNSLISCLDEEFEEINDLDGVIFEVFKHGEEMSTDILEYTTEIKKDLEKFKKIMIELAEVQKGIRCLGTTITKLDSAELELLEAEPPEIARAFDRIHNANLESQEMAEEVDNLIAAVDSYMARQCEVVDSMDAVDDSELIVTSTTESYKDPLTKLTLTDPVKSAICNHTYERSTILRYLQKNSRCPYSGCVAVFKREDLVDDLETKRNLLNLKN